MPTRIRTHTALFALIAASAVLAFACSGSSNPKPTATPPPAHFADAPCKVATPAGQTLRCGVLTVPENRKKAGSRTIDLTVAVMKSTSATPAPDPMLYLSGGPGQPGLANNMQAFDAAFAAPVQSKRDLVFLDQRGTGDSIPSLACPEVNDAFRKSLAEDLRNDATTAGRVREALLRLSEVDFVAVNGERLNVLKRDGVKGYVASEDREFDVLRQMARGANLPPYEKY